MAPDDPSIRIPIKDLRQEEGAQELATSPGMEPYLNFAMALMRGADPEPALEAIRQLPVERRYVWRVASALKWAFADFDVLSVSADKETISGEELDKVMDLLRFRPLQLCIFLKALLGVDDMQKIMVEAIKTAKQV